MVPSCGFLFLRVYGGGCALKCENWCVCVEACLVKQHLLRIANSHYLTLPDAKWAIWR